MALPNNPIAYYEVLGFEIDKEGMKVPSAILYQSGPLKKKLIENATAIIPINVAKKASSFLTPK